MNTPKSRNQLSAIEYGPAIEETYLTAGLDYYKPTMSQFVYEKEPDAEVTFTFKNRGQQRLLDYVSVEELQTAFAFKQARGFDQAELDYLAQLTNVSGERIFADDYLNHLKDTPLPDVTVEVKDNDIAICTTGEWAMTTFWETVVMSEVNERYFENYVRANGIDVMDLYDEGDRRLSEKIAFLQANPDIKVAEFGTRRRFSLKWQKHVVERLRNECPENLLGTSNVALANSLGLKPIGTFAHELPMGYAGLADARGEDILDSHGKMLDDWYDFYGDELAIALSDTFGSDFFFEDFTPERSAKYKGTRQDSGDPMQYGEQAIAHYEAAGIDPATKMTLFSDSLNMPKVAEIHQNFAGRTKDPYGVGTDLTNDLGVKALNVVMKLTRAKDTRTGNEAATVKLSDDPGKHTGPAEKVAEYMHLKEERMRRVANISITKELEMIVQ